MLQILLLIKMFFFFTKIVSATKMLGGLFSYYQKNVRKNTHTHVLIQKSLLIRVSKTALLGKNGSKIQYKEKWMLKKYN